MKNSIVVIPTYNEKDNIQHIIEAVFNVCPDMNVLIVDDNSPDGTADIVRKMQENDSRLHLMVRAGKLGLGTAYCEGFAYALDKNFDYIFEMDADFSHNPEDLPRFFELIDKYDLVIGSRYIEGFNVVNWPLRRLILSYGASIYARVITGMPIKDCTGGFKCFKASALRKIDLNKIHSNGYGFQLEMNYRLWKKGGKIKEMPIIFTDRRSGQSKMNKSIIVEAVFLVIKLRVAAMFGKMNF